MATPVTLVSDSTLAAQASPLGTSANPLITQGIAGTASGTKTEDTPHVTGDAGSASLWVRNDVRTSRTDADGDYTNPSVDAFGSVWNRDALLLTSDMTLGVLNIATATTTAVCAAVASQTSRVHRLRIAADAAQQITVQDGVGAVLEIINFTAAGVRIYDFSSRPWYKTSTNTALNFVTTTTGQVRGVIEFITSAT